MIARNSYMRPKVQNEVNPLNESTGVVCVSSEPEL